MNIKINIPENINIVMNRLKENGYVSYVVGGCVRDSILGRTPNDWDLCTPAIPPEVIAMFDDYRVVETALKHGTVTIVVNGEHVEVTTFRRDGDYSDGRRPDNVLFTSDLITDLSRRDFTINAMAYNDDEGLIDYFGGLDDIKNKSIRCVGDANKRFSDDALRIMRCIRFALRFNFVIEDKTYDAMMVKSKLVYKNVSIERVQSEFNKIILFDVQTGIMMLRLLDILDYIMPSIEECFMVHQNNPYHKYNVGLHSLIAAKSIEPTLHLILTMLLHDVGKPKCKSTDEVNIDHFYKHNIVSSNVAEMVLRRLKYDNNTINKVKLLILYHDADIHPNKKSVKKWLSRIGEDMFRDLVKVKIADMNAQSEYAKSVKEDSIMKLKIMLENVLKDDECFTIKDLDINGNDLIKLGFHGKEIGDMLNKILNYVIDNPDKNNKENLIKFCKGEM